MFRIPGNLIREPYGHTTLNMPGFVRTLMGKIYRSPRLLKKDVKNAKNAAANSGSFENETGKPSFSLAFLPSLKYYKKQVR